MPIYHAKTLTIADLTGTATFWNGATTGSAAATDLLQPSDHASAHKFTFSLGGNTIPGRDTTFGGTDWYFSGLGGVQLGGSGATLHIQGAPLNSFVPYYPGSTSSQTMGAIGASTGSGLFFPLVLPVAFVGNHIKQLFSASLATTTNAASQTITSRFGIYTNNAGTLSLISSGSFSIALSLSGVSGTISMPTGTGTSGYAYGTYTWSTTAQGQSLIGTAGNRIVNLQFGGDLSLTPGVYYLGYHQRQSTTNAAAGLSTALLGLVQGPVTNVGPLELSTNQFTSRSDFHFNLGAYTSTNSANYSGTNLPSNPQFSGFNFSGNVLPFLTLAST